MFSSSNEGKKQSFGVLPARHCFGGMRGNTIDPSGVALIDWKSRFASSAALHGHVMTHSVTVFIDRSIVEAD